MSRKENTAIRLGRTRAIGAFFLMWHRRHHHMAIQPNSQAATVVKAVTAATQLLAASTRARQSDGATLARVIVKAAIQYHGRLPESVSGIWTRTFLATPRDLVSSPSMVKIHQIVSSLMSRFELEALLVIAAANELPPITANLQGARDRLAISQDKAYRDVGDALQMLQRGYVQRGQLPKK